MPQTKLHVVLLRHTVDPDALVATAAKLCYSPACITELSQKVGEQDNREWVEKLAQMGHHSPLEHSVFTFGVEGVSRSLLAQITRHRIASFSVQSQRYVKTGQKNGFGYVIPPSIEGLGPYYVHLFEEQMNKIQEWYNGWVDALGGGRDAYEDARFVLPNAAETKLVVTMNARELQHFFHVRCCQRVQWEIRALADEMLRLAKETAPALFAGAGPACVSGPCPEGKMGCGRASGMRERYRD